MTGLPERGATPWIYRPSKTAGGPSGIGIYVPYTPGRREAWRDVLGGGVPIAFEPDARLWILARRHMRKAAETLAGEFGRCLVYTEHSLSEKCTTSCKKAEVLPIEECECCCIGEFHGDGWFDGWRLLDGDCVVRDQVKIAVREVIW